MNNNNNNSNSKPGPASNARMAGSLVGPGTKQLPQPNSRKLPTDENGDWPDDGDEPTLKPAARAARQGKRSAFRDRHLLVVLHEARYLSEEQLRTLFFPGRAHATARQRLAKLAGGEGHIAYVQKHEHRSAVDPTAPNSLWSLAPAGYALVERLQGEAHRRMNDLEPDYFDHHLLFTELYVRLLGAVVARQIAAVPAGLTQAARTRALWKLHARAEHPAWRWKVTGDDMELPWRAYNATDGQSRDRLIRPDAILELVEHRRRLFVEGETGSHSIKAKSPEKTGATMSKVVRYSEYVDGFANPTKRLRWYDARFPDGYTPELLIIVPTATRAANIQAAVAAWMSKLVTPTRLVVKALTVDQAAAALLPLVGAPASAVAASATPAGSPKPAPLLTDSQLDVVVDFFVALRADFKERTARAKAQRLPPPTKPQHYDAMKAIVADLYDIQQARRRE